MKENTVIGLLISGCTLLVGLCVWGWVWNIVKIADSSFDPLSAIVVLRCIGVFVAPLGVVLGFI